ncbi:WD repeat-containing protein 93 isoform X2 [Patella vulgata]|uniref:WD repeat-containing protein 93 isoform X2 n=1 Tax=Patella vulgata TaxID=6465 RepID=UPI00218011CD|nr:WD repeat-containing protein 93 isoform X2 [Patella vulgata]
MPVYVRKNMTFTPPSLENIADLDENDFEFIDPDKLRDQIPQPYRLVNKIVDSVVEKAWSFISEIETKKTANLNKIRPPKYDCAVKLQNHEKATALTDSVDGRYVFIGLSNGIVAIDSLTQETVATWDEEKVDIVHIKCHLIGVQTYLLVTIDEMGIVKLFIFSSEQIFLLKILNEQVQEPGSTKIISTKCESSDEGDYIGIVLENTSSSEIWLELHRLPRDTWLREMETVVAELKALSQQQEEEAAMAAEGTDDNTQVFTERKGSTTNIKIPPTLTIGVRRGSNSNTLLSHSIRERRGSSGNSLSPTPKTDTSIKKRRKTRSPSGSPKPGTPPPLLTLTPGEKPNPKFTPQSLVLKIHPPQPITGSTSSSVMSACQKVDSGEVIGTGQHHIITSGHLEQRDSLFEQQHENMMKYLPEADNQNVEIMQPTFHFVTSSRLTPVGLEQPSQTGRPTTVVVWWTGESNLRQYSLLKQSKDFDHKADVVWPFCSTITCSTTSLCGTYLAVGLRSGNVVLWDRYLGIEKGVIGVSSEYSIKQLQFLDPSISSQDITDYPPYKTTISAWLLIQTSDNSQYIYNTSLNTLVVLYTVNENNEEETVLSTVSGIPELLLVVTEDRSLLLKDVTNGQDVCQLTLPTLFDLTSPWEPIYSFGGGGQMLYVKGSSSSKDEEGAIIDESSLFVYQLRSFPSLDGYWKRPRNNDIKPVHSTVEQRVNALLKHRIAVQPERKERLQKRWNMMQQELDIILQCQETAKKRTCHAYSYFDQPEESEN